MTTSEESPEGKNAYFIDSEDATEMARLLEQDLLVTRSMGGLFPERSDNLEGISGILDVACGPGGWVMSVAREYPHIQVTGIDISERMVRYAQAHAQARGFSNAHFQVMDALKPLGFPDASFDLVNARTVVGLMTPQTWPPFVRELMRISRPRGTIRLTEFEMPLTNSPAFEAISGLLLQAMHKVGRSYSPDGRHFTITPLLGALLQEAGCQDIQQKPYANDFSAGTEANAGSAEDIMIGFSLLLPFLLRLKMITKDAYDLLHQQMVGEMLSDSFRGLTYGLTVWGRRP